MEYESKNMERIKNKVLIALSFKVKEFSGGIKL